MINPIDIMFKAINLKFNVEIVYLNSEINNEIKEMTYLELGSNLVLNNQNINKVIIIIKND